MKRLLLLLILVVSVTLPTISCAPRAVKPKVSINNIEDRNYPCINVSFLYQIIYNGMKVKTYEDDYVALIYNLLMPGYTASVIKLYALQNPATWSKKTFLEIFEYQRKIYERVDSENLDKSAVVVLAMQDDGLYLKGLVGDFLSDDRAVRVEINRRVKTGKVIRDGVIESWVASSTGKRSIENMKKLVDYTYNNLRVIGCDPRGNINSNWWK